LIRFRFPDEFIHREAGDEGEPHHQARHDRQCEPAAGDAVPALA
jgi:hypothetical protein